MLTKANHLISVWAFPAIMLTFAANQLGVPYWVQSYDGDYVASDEMSGLANRKNPGQNYGSAIKSEKYRRSGSSFIKPSTTCALTTQVKP